MTLNGGNICAGLQIEDVKLANPFQDMMMKQVLFQMRLGKVPENTASMTERAAMVVYWRHCAQSEVDELLEWFDTPNSDLVELQMEVSDILHFVFNMAISVGLHNQAVQELMHGFTWTAEESISEEVVIRRCVDFSKAMTKFIDTLPWKTWKNYTGRVVSTLDMQVSYATMLRDLMLLAGALGMDLQRVVNVYCAKNKENHARQDRGY